MLLNAGACTRSEKLKLRATSRIDEEARTFGGQRLSRGTPADGKIKSMLRYHSEDFGDAHPRN